MRTLSFLVIALVGCGPQAPSEVDRPASLNVPLVSQRNAPASHRARSNCMSCHQENGLGKGLFTVAGTAVTSDGKINPNVTVQLTTQPFGKGDVVVSIEADSGGNFYTTDPVGFPERSLFPYLVNATTERTKGMPFPTMSGACNVCHVGRNPVDLD